MPHYKAVVGGGGGGFPSTEQFSLVALFAVLLLCIA